jgi:hypothetical protein
MKREMVEKMEGEGEAWKGDERDEGKVVGEAWGECKGAAEAEGEAEG